MNFLKIFFPFFLLTVCVSACKSTQYVPISSGNNNGIIVENINHLRKLAPPQYAATATVKGYHTAYDGGGGVFIWEAQSKETVDEGFVFASENGNGRWRRLQAAEGKMIFFGVVPNAQNRNFDLMPFVKAACQYAKEKEIRVLEWANGKFFMSNTVEIPEGITFKGQGVGSTLVVANGNFSAFRLKYNASLVYAGVKDLEVQTSQVKNGFPAIDFNNPDPNDARAAHYYHVENIKVQSFYENSDGRFDIGIRSRYWIGTIRDCFINRVNSCGVQLLGDVKNPSRHSIQAVFIDNVLIATISDAVNGKGIEVVKSDGSVTIQNCTIEGQQKQGIVLQDVRNAVLLNNYFESTIQGIEVTNITVNGCSNINIIGGTFMANSKDYPIRHFWLGNGSRDINLFGINTNYTAMTIDNAYVNFFGGQHDIKSIQNKSGIQNLHSIYNTSDSKMINKVKE